MGLFTKEWITFRKTFRIAICFLIGLWFELCAFTCIVNAVPITNRICALRGNILLLLHRLTHACNAWLQRAFPKCACTNHVPKELCIHTFSESGFLGGSRSKTPFFLHFKSLIWKSFAFTKGKIRLSNQERVWITFRNGFRNMIHSFVNRPITPPRTQPPPTSRKHSQINVNVRGTRILF